MFDFALTSEQELLRETARSFAESRLRAHQREHEQHGLSEGCARAYGEIGFPRMQAPVAEGGVGAGAVEKVVALEELAWGDAASTLALESRGWLIPLVGALPEGAQVRLQGDLLRTELRAAVFWDRDGCVQRSASRWHGRIPYLPANPLHWLILRSGSLLAIFSAHELVLQPVAPGALHAAGASEVSLEAAEAVALLEAEDMVERFSALLRLEFAALLLGLTRAAHEYALRYACERVVFGKPIAHHQAPAFELADMRIGIEAARALLWRAAAAWDQGEGQVPLLAAFAYLEAAELALGATRDAVQLLGGHGFLRDHPVEKWMREARALTLLWGGRDAACDDAARWTAVEASDPGP